MASQKSAKYPYKWPNGEWHSTPWEKTKRAQAGAKPTAPIGTYDPALDAELGRSERGFDDLLRDIGSGEDGQPLGTLRERAQHDLTTRLGQLGLTKTRGQEDYDTATGNLETSYGRSRGDLLQARGRGKEDYETSIANLQRQFQRLGTAQGEGQRKAGAMMGSGAALQAARKRAANEAIERQPLDTSYRRFTDDSATAESRLTEDRGTSLAALLRARDRGFEDVDFNIDQTALGAQRQNEDWGTQLSRAGREQTHYRSDIDRAKIAQALQNNPGAKLPITYPAPPPKKPAPPPKGLGGPVAPLDQTTLSAGAGIPGTKKRRRGRTVTYGNSVGGP